MRRRRKSIPRALRDLVAGVYPSKEPGDVKAIRAFAWWSKAVPERVAENARPVRLDRGVLLVHAKNTVWAHELDYLKHDLLKRLGQVAPNSGIRAIRVRVGELPPVPRSTRPAPELSPPIPVRELPEDLARALATVADDDIRDVVRGAASVALGRREKG